MAIPTLIPDVATLSAQDHPHHEVRLGLGTEEVAFGEDKLPCARMDVEDEVKADAEAGEASPPKKVRRDVTGVEMILRQTAEIEMVLVGMAALRGGAPPTPVECHLAVKAYSNLEGLVERVAPSDLVSKKFLQSLIKQFSVSQQPALPLVSRPTPAKDVSTSSMGPPATRASAKATSAPGKRARVAVKTPKPKAVAKRDVSKHSVARTKDPQIVPITETGEKVGKGPKSLLRGRGAKIAEPLIDQRQIHQQIALEIELSMPDVFMAALSETAGAYINSPIRCDTCKVLINDTGSALICDGCGAGFHLVCLQMRKRSAIPEGDWYCSKCEAVSGGQPRQSIYGTLRRGRGRRGSRTTWILKSASEVPSTKASEYRLKLRNTSSAQDVENLGAAEASSVIHAADTQVESSSKTQET
ncbi:hypothetical protein M758_12G153100 [Ceratodon purpureus]|nr:hypothetical protein M758_12G153100 [Ceratodon purpureus]